MLPILLLFKFFLFAAPKEAKVPATIYEYKVAGLSGGTIDFAAYKGKKILIVNTASKCGYTPQYAALEKLYESRKDKLVIVGFPANDFGSQEPGTNEEIGAFCTRNYGVTFPMAAKVSVKGDGMVPIYHWLTEKKYNKYQDSEIKWNFQKYLIDENGKLVALFPSASKPDSPEVLAAIDK